MRFWSLVSILPFVLASDVHDLTGETFKKFSQQPLSLIEFFAPWCGHCKALAPEYEKAATILKKAGIPIAKVDCTVEQEVCQEMGVKGYPTLKVFRNGHAVPYEGGRKEADIVQYMKRMSRPLVSILKNKKALEALTKDENVLIVSWLSAKADLKVFEDAAVSFRDKVSFASFEVNEKSLALAKEYGLTKEGIVAFKQFDDKLTIYKGKVVEKDLIAWVTKESTPLMDDIGPQNYEKYTTAGVPLAYLFVENDEQRETPGQAVKNVAKHFKGKVNFVFVDASKFGGHAANLNLEEGAWPAFAVEEHVKGNTLKYPFKEEITEAAITEFVQGVVDKKIKPDFKSQPTPETNDGPVFILTGNTFEEVIGKEKDVLLEMYAPWCGHCQRLEPIYNELGTLIKGLTDKIIIAKMDGTANDLPSSADFSVQGFPTLRFYKAGSMVSMEYEKDRTLAALIDYLKSNSSFKNEIKFPDKVEEEEEEDEEKGEDDEDDEKEEL